MRGGCDVKMPNNRDVRDCESGRSNTAIGVGTVPRVKGLTDIDSTRRSSSDKLFIFVDENFRLIRYSFYALGALGALVLLRSLHVHKKFTKLSSISAEFISKNVPFRGRVKAVDREHRLHVDHLPIVTSRWMPAGDGLLSVRLAGVQVSPVGSKWLADHVLDRVVKITPLQVSADVLDGVVFLEKGWLRRSVCVNERLVEQGLCKVRYPTPLPTSPRFVHLLDTLVRYETQADRKGRGLWGNTTPQTTSPETRRWSVKHVWNWLRGKFVRKKS